ncbi:MAG: hypothetical protein LBN94_00330 [Puniceicoccales bacterium]|nr:hypothetical protein [Puniceicoccales bacterium]
MKKVNGWGFKRYGFLLMLGLVGGVGAEEINEHRDAAEIHYRLDVFPKEFQRKFRIGPYSLFSKDWRIFPFHWGDINASINPVEAMKKFMEACAPEKNVNVSSLDSYRDISEEFLISLAKYFQKNIIFLEVGDGVTWHPDFFEKLILVRKDGVSSTLESEGLDDGNILEELNDGDLTEHFINGTETFTFVYHRGIGGLFFCAISSADQFEPQTVGDQASSHAEELNEKRESRWQNKQERALRSWTQAMLEDPILPPGGIYVKDNGGSRISVQQYMHTHPEAEVWTEEEWMEYKKGEKSQENPKSKAKNVPHDYRIMPGRK